MQIMLFVEAFSGPVAVLIGTLLLRAVRPPNVVAVTVTRGGFSFRTVTRSPPSSGPIRWLSHVVGIIPEFHLNSPASPQ